jgi:hypothetical protein
LEDPTKLTLTRKDHQPCTDLGRSLNTDQPICFVAYSTAKERLARDANVQRKEEEEKKRTERGKNSV